MKVKCFVVAVFLSQSLIGCSGAFIDYIEPTGVPTATLRVDMAPAAIVGIYKNEHCDKLPDGVRFNGFPNAKVEPGRLVDLSGRRIPVQNGLVVSFHNQVIAYQKTENCAISLSFDPEPNAIYEAVSRYTGMKCYASIFKIVTVNGVESRVEDPSAKMTPKVCDVLSD